LSGKVKKLEVTEEELALLQCAIVHCDMFWRDPINTPPPLPNKKE